MIKKYDIVATIGTYQKGTETKNKYKNIGAVFEKDGNPFILIDRTFNLAGMPGDKENVLLSLFTPKDKGSDYNQGLQQKSSDIPLDDEIPFN